MIFFNLKEADNYINRSDKDIKKIPVSEEETAYYEPFKNVKGCKVMNFVSIDSKAIYHLCIQWKGVLMMASVNYMRDWIEYNTFDLKLFYEMDWKDIQKARVEKENIQKPNKIGKPTPKKLDQWLEYLQALRQEEIKARDRRIAYMIGKIEQVKTLFPEARNVEWSKGDRWDSYWHFELEKGGLKYTITIRRTGEIQETMNIVYSSINTAERMAKMSNNDYTPIVFEHIADEMEYVEKQNEILIQQHLGQQLQDVDDIERLLSKN